MTKFKFLAEALIFVFATISKLDLGSTQPFV
jgi:hypothetical protein